MILSQIKKNSFLGVILIAFCYIYGYYGEAISHPNSYLFAAEGDGIKNYYTYAYHVSNDSTLSYFEGMNYPYGDLVVFTDGHPLLANIIKVLSGWFPAIEDYSIGILNLIMILSGIITIVALFLIMRKYKVGFWFAVFGSIAIYALQPQAARLTGHLSLSYSFFIPVTWLLLLEFNEQKNTKYLIYIFLLLIALLFTHPYMAVISIFCITFWGLFSYKLNISFWKLIGVSFLAIFSFKLYLFIFDFHLGRAVEPLGFIEPNMIATLKSIFLSSHFPMHDLYFSAFNLAENMPWEGRAYPGFAAIIIAIMASIFWLTQIIKQKINFKSFPSDNLFVPGGVALIALLYSFGMPYNLGFGFIADWVKELKEIRVVGRFAWIFFYFFSVIVIISIYRFSLKNKLLGTLLFVFFIFFNLLEGHYVHEPISKAITKNQNPFSSNSDYSHQVQQIDISFEKYQAIIPLPFYHIGSEHNIINYEKSIFYHSQLLSYILNKPLFSSSLSRTSISESINIANIIAPNYFNKNLSSELNDSDSFLIIVENKESLNSFEKNILKKSKYLTTKNTIHYYEISYNNLFKPDSNFKRKEAGFFIEDSTYRITHSNPKAFVYFNPFEEFQSPNSFLSRGSYVGMKKQFNNLFSSSPGQIKPNTTYHLSFWVYGKDPLSTNNMGIIIETLDNGKSSWAQLIDLKKSYCIINDWHLINTSFHTQSNISKLELLTKAYTIEDMEISIDNVLVHEDKDTIVYYIDSIRYINNIPFLHN